MSNPNEDLLRRFGFPDADLAKLATNTKLFPVAKEFISLLGVDTLSKTQGALLYSLITRYPPEANEHKALVPPYIGNGKINQSIQVDAALVYLKRVGLGKTDVAEFEKTCGVGVVVSDKEMDQAVAKVLADSAEKIKEERYRVNVGLLLKLCKDIHPWADGKVMREKLDAALAKTLGPRTAEDDKPLEKKPKAAAPPKDKAASGSEKKTATELANESEQAVVKRFPMPEENTSNTPELLQAHLKRTGSRVITRFPPEPNGFLHIGHAKAMNLSFTFAKNYGGECILRFDDTNPDGESQEFIDSIIDNVKWLGWTPSKITYASDYMEQLYNIALDLIERDLAFACHQTADEMHRDREKKVDSPYRNRPRAESRKIFEDMRKGKYDEGAAVLRLKMDMKNDNPVFRDPVAWRVKFTPHPHVGDAWCIYPTYDYTHCLNDSLEDITHSLCSLEFQVRHDSYMWLLDAARMYKPVVWEFSRLNLSHTVMSKRKLKQLVEQGHVRGWDDPRMPTLMGFRRKGYSPDAINAFVKEIGVTRAANMIDMNVLEHNARIEMNDSCPRAFAVIDPLRVVLTNWPKDKVQIIEASPDRKMPISRVVYIEHSDFRPEDHKEFYGLAPNKEVILRYAFNIRCDSFSVDKNGKPTEIQATYLPDSTVKCKGVLHWVAEPSPGVAPTSAEVRLYNRLLTVADPNDMEGAANWLDFVNKDAEVVMPNAIVEPGLANVAPWSRFQFERLGFFCADLRDSRPGHLVFNRTVSLREDKGKKA